MITNRADRNWVENALCAQYPASDDMWNLEGHIGRTAATYRPIVWHMRLLSARNTEFGEGRIRKTANTRQDRQEQKAFTEEETARLLNKTH